MLVGGKRLDIDVGDFDTLVKILDALPAGFSKRNLNITENYFFSSEVEACKQYEKGEKFHRIWEETRSRAYFNDAVQSFLKSAEMFGEKGNFTVQAWVLHACGNLYLSLGMKERAISVFEKALDINKEQENYDRLLVDVTELYSTICDVIEDKEDSGLTGTNSLREKLESLGELAVDLFSRDRGEPINPDAYRVEQGEIGFSDKELIGTDHINSCVCVIVRDPKTHKTALAHVDENTDIPSLQEIFDRMPKDGTLDVRLVGVAYGNVANHDKYSLSSKRNLDGVMRFLEGKNVNIVSSDVFNSNQPSTLVVNPENFELSEEMPGVINPDKCLADGKCFFEGAGKSLQVTLDLTTSKKRTPVLLSSSAVNDMHDWIGERDEYEIARLCIDNSICSKDELPVYAAIILKTLQAYKKSAEHAFYAFEEKLEDIRQGSSRAGKSKSIAEIFDDLEKTNFISEKQKISNAKAEIRKHAIYIGQDAKQANQSLIDLINNDLFVEEDMPEPGRDGLEP